MSRDGDDGYTWRESMSMSNAGKGPASTLFKIVLTRIVEANESQLDP